MTCNQSRFFPSLIDVLKAFTHVVQTPSDANIKMHLNCLQLDWASVHGACSRFTKSTHTNSWTNTERSLKASTPLFLCVISRVTGLLPQLVKRECEPSSILSSAGEPPVRRFYPLDHSPFVQYLAEKPAVKSKWIRTILAREMQSTKIIIGEFRLNVFLKPS